MKKRPSDRTLKMMRTKHARRAMRETLAYKMSHPVTYSALEFAWHGCVTIPSKPHFKDYFKLLKSDLPVLT